MESRFFLDTHVLVWLYAGELKLIPKKTLQLMEKARLEVSPMALLEIDYLKEAKRIQVSSDIIVKELAHEIDLKISNDSFYKVYKNASALTWTRDPFDRIIVGQSMVQDITLITKDKLIRKKYKNSLW